MITIQNLEANPTSDIQAVNGISFSLSTGQTAGSIFSSSAIKRTISGTGAGGYSDAGPSSTNWLYNQAGLGVEITNIGNAQAKQTLIGNPNGGNAYSNANGSIAGSVHNPFLAGIATFDLHITGVTADTMISTLRFEFGTTAGTNVTGTPVGAVPEPASLAMVLGGLGVVGLCVKRSRRGTARS